MDPALIPAPLNVRSLLNQHGLQPRKSLGQNFLVENNALEKVVDSAEIEPIDVVLEIGAGLGSLTRFLARVARKVVTVELDHHLIPVLETVLNSEGNVELVHGDILKLEPERLISVNQYLVVANIPYYITSAIFRHLLESKRKPRRIVMTIQKEVIIQSVLRDDRFRVKIDTDHCRVDIWSREKSPGRNFCRYFWVSKNLDTQSEKT